MKLVIDIDDNFYYGIVNNKYGVYTGRIFDIISNGTPLPKGHGRLIDADALVSEIKDLKKSPWYKDNTNFAYLPRKEAVEIIEELIIGDAPTIIEADNAESEDV